MNEVIQSRELQSKSIYSDACENSEEIEQIYLHSKITKKQKKEKDDIIQDNSSMKLYTKNSLNEKRDIGILNNNKEKYSVSEYKSCYEEKIKENDDSLNNNLNINKQNKILENLNDIKHVDLSTINSNNISNTDNFLEENTDLGLNKIIEINFNIKRKDSKDSEYTKLKKNKKTKNSISFYDNLRHEESFSNESKNKINNPFYNKTFSSLFTNNKYFLESNRNHISKNIIKPEQELCINKIKFEGIQNDKIDKDYFYLKFKTLEIKNKNINNPNNKHIKTLFELQEIIGDYSAVTTLKINEEGKYLAAGFKSGIIKIYEIMNYTYDKYKLIYDKNNLKEYLYFLNDTSFKTLTSHSSEIIDIFWLLSSKNFLLSSSLNLIILWDFNPDNINILKKYRQSNDISCLSINTIMQNMFATGSKDKILTIFSIPQIYYDKNFKSDNLELNNENVIKEINLQEEIISINFLQEGDKIAIGTNKGKILVYKIIPEIVFDYKFDCKNRIGKPITNITFFSSSSCIISSLDSRIRFVNISNGEIIHKYKGHKNEKYNIKTYVDTCNDYIINGSENGKCYIWNVFNKENEKIKNYSYEYFKPFENHDVINLTQIVSEKCYVNYYQKILKITNKIMLDSIIICADCKGKIKILLNINESY